MKTYNLFVASPGDVIRERKKVVSVVNAINRTVGSTLSMRFEPFLWEQDAVPDFGKPAQAIINEQAISGNKMHCAIFILWHRYGTPTGSSGSGWEEELELFAEQLRGDPNFRIMFFVKREKICPRNVDALQLHKVNQFLSSIDGLYSEFLTLKEFSEKLGSSLSVVMKRFDEVQKENRILL